MTRRRRRGVRHAMVALGLTAALIGLELAPASAKEDSDSFAGVCSFQGTVKFSPRATNSQRTLSTWYDATGSCNGDLNGTPVSNAPVTMGGGAHAVDGSCRQANTTKPGRAEITFADGSVIAFTFEFSYVRTEGVWSVRGQQSGSAVAHASFLTDRAPPDASAQCAGDGVREIAMDTQLATDSPLVSGNERGGQ